MGPGCGLRTAGKSWTIGGLRNAVRRRVRRVHEGAIGRLALGFGLTAATAISLPLLVSVVVGRPGWGGLVALGAYMVATTAIKDPAGGRFPTFFVATLAATGGVALGVLIAGRPWLLAGGGAAVAALGGLVPAVGPTGALALVLTASRPHYPEFAVPILLTFGGGLLVGALLSLPWRWRHTRPLRTAVVAAANDIAALLEVATDPLSEDAAWEGRRRAAGKSLRQARTACARHHLRRQGREAARLVVVLRRILYETVALRGLCSVLRRQSPDALTDSDSSATVAPLVAALRVVFDGGLDVVGVAPGTSLADRIGVLRADLPHDRRSLLELLQLRQIQRCLDRIGESVGVAAELSVGGLYGGPAGPRIPPHISPVVSARPQFTSQAARHAVRLAVGVGAALVIIAIWRPPFGYWLALTVLLSLQATYGGTLSRVVARTCGGVVGALLAAGVLVVAPGNLALTAVVALVAVLAFTLSAVHYVYWSALVTTLVMLLVDFRIPFGPEAAGSRILMTLLGGLLTLTIARMLWPRGEAARLPARVNRLLHAHAAECRTVASFDRGEGSRSRVEKAVLQTGSAEEDLAASVNSAAGEPGVAVPDSLREVARASGRVRDDVMMMVTVMGPTDIAPVQAVLGALADRFEHCVEAVESRRAYQSEGEVDRRLAELSTWVSDLTESRIKRAAEEAPEERRALLHAVVAEHALRELNADSARLCAVASAAFAVEEPDDLARQPAGSGETGRS
ncbi:FUSC family protein [Rhizohabitans arisaemae]|uniref:FUSC family protein n=1 Tax=Rhizohabitans arisaemae TaxID=2720610 RepID=UPI0024B21A6F|nr:FUSC family protein [Rhizohabitans arisaemae]